MLDHRIQSAAQGIQGARAQLEALVTVAADLRQRPSAPDGDPLPDEEPAPLRRAAVLILFGVLDGLPSDHTARAEAVSHDLDVLLLARGTSLRSHPGQIAFPGGRVDPEDAGPVDTALREAREETGVDTSGVDVLGALPEVPLAFSHHIVTPVLGWWRTPSPVRVVDEVESADVFRTPVADLLDPANRGSTVVRRDGRTWRAPAFVVHQASGDHLVWGFTGMLLNGLFDRLGWTEPWDADRVLEIPFFA